MIKNRQLCLRIDGIASDENESNEECLEEVKAVFANLQVNVPEDIIDRAHRIGRPKILKGKKLHTMILRFTTWRHHTAFYRARKNSPSNRVQLDLTKKRLDTVKRLSRSLESGKLGLLFADITCRLCARIDGKFHYFKNEDHLMKIIDEAALNEEDAVNENS